MDASASHNVSTDYKNVCGFFLKIEDSTIPAGLKQKSSIIKYTKLPDFGFNSQERDNRKSPIKTSHRAAETEYTSPKPILPSTRNTRSAYSKCPKKQEAKSCGKSTNNKIEVCNAKMNYNNRNANLKIQIIPPYTNRPRTLKEKDTNANNSNPKSPTRSSLSRKVTPTSESGKVILIKNKLKEDVKPNTQPKNVIEKHRTITPFNKKNTHIVKEIKNRSKPVSVIHVPLDEKYQYAVEKEVSYNTIRPLAIDGLTKIDCSTEIEHFDCIETSVGTDPEPQKSHKLTEVYNSEFLTLCSKDSQFDSSKELYLDSLDIPNVTLLKDKCDISLDKKVNFCSQSLPDLKVPTLKITPQRDEINSKEMKSHKSTSFIIGSATVTYTTRQKINFHVVGKNQDSQLSSSPLAYPLSVVSVFKKEINNGDVNDATLLEDINKKQTQSKTECVNCLNEIKSLDCSYVFDSTKLVKPSDIISTIRVNNSLLNNDYICEQFQRELNFIDSFFESLQYLESCSLSDKCFKNNKVGHWVSNSGFDMKHPEYDSFFSKFQNHTNNDDSETMASKSLCLLNLLIRDEQRRAKNLLFVLKMREDALKDFTKSQILWLENKKKQDNIDISTLKKKQRGALLKLQHECGEMQRMRKALLALSEKRKVALMKTKKNIELKLKNNVDTFFIGKKKLKRNTATDRNIAPLKCFDLSSSGCEENTLPRPKSDSILALSEISTIVKSAEKCVQTGDSLIGKVQVDSSTDTAAENFVGVDGGYLNIIFGHLSLPQIFSSGKQYEVNEEALKNIVSSTNLNRTLKENDFMENFLDKIKSRDLDRSSTPSTARSLVEEFDQYYKGFVDEDKSGTEFSDREYKSSNGINQILPDDIMLNKCQNSLDHSESTVTVDSANTVLNTSSDVLTEEPGYVDRMISVETQVLKGKDSVTTATQAVSLSVPAGPLPVPVGEAASDFAAPAVLPDMSSPPALCSTVSDGSQCDSSQFVSATFPSLSSLASPVHCEAEELRRQQLAIEREIKALEQQQCQLLVVREIPDKPPPPYTAPIEPKPSKLPRMFSVDYSVEDKIRRSIIDPSTLADLDPTDAFDVFLKDFCEEKLEKQSSEQSDKPWDACNLLPQKSLLGLEDIISKTTSDLKEVLTGVTPTVVSGVGTRRSDHIDDILFAEWRRCEPEWTALHSDEAVVKSQIFESIFQRILTETIDEYKKTVLSVNGPVTDSE